MNVVERSLHVAAPAPVVWSIVEDLRHMPELSESTISVDPPVRLTEVGQTFEQVVRLAGRRFASTWTLQDLQPGRCLSVEGQLGSRADRRGDHVRSAAVPAVPRPAPPLSAHRLMRGVRYTITQTVEPVSDAASRLTFAMGYELPLGVLGRLAGRLGAERRALTEADQVMAGIKALAERAPAGPDTDRPTPSRTTP